MGEGEGGGGEKTSFLNLSQVCSKIEDDNLDLFYLRLGRQTRI